MKIENVVVISLEDYERFQELEANASKKEIDYSILKTGSRVKLKIDKPNEITAYSSRFYNEDRIYSIVLKDSNFLVDKDGLTKSSSGNIYTTLVDGDVFINIIGLLEGKVTEVIEY